VVVTGSIGDHCFDDARAMAQQPRITARFVPWYVIV
jgi:hypothetical protein